jgi:hypothetical protein
MDSFPAKSFQPRRYPRKRYSFCRATTYNYVDCYNVTRNVAMKTTYPRIAVPPLPLPDFAIGNQDIRTMKKKEGLLGNSSRNILPPRPLLPLQMVVLHQHLGGDKLCLASDRPGPRCELSRFCQKNLGFNLLSRLLIPESAATSATTSHSSGSMVLLLPTFL